ncbi:hypothetical protein MOQ_004092 [Trypanosoma cruzi marinkellei]|uniref:Uncharacterized protein n=1 Tax=Trypanosoma cruzi marinkellei TaxID=85056 RepID=K2N289_TRYCR|nr:hypothetical protein MOQ_004092 [Trypanosoma cruzi marinkellei]
MSAIFLLTAVESVREREVQFLCICDIISFSATARSMRVPSRRWRLFLNYFLRGIVWWVGAFLVGQIYPDSVKIYVMVTVLLGIFASLDYGPREQAMKTTDVNVCVASKSNRTEATANRADVTVVNDTAAFAVVNSNGMAACRGVSAVEKQRVVFAALKGIGTPQALRAIQDEKFREDILCSTLDASLCCCGSGRRFARCCRLLQEELRGCGL